MASVTSIKFIQNLTKYKISIYNGENNTTYAIDSKGILGRSIWIPWIGRQDEVYKALLIKTVEGIEYHCYIFQDYWEPPGVSPVKTCRDSELLYLSNHPLITGEALYGGDRFLVIYEEDGDIKLLLNKTFN